MTIDKPVEIFYGMYDNANIENRGVWHLKNGLINNMGLDHSPNHMN